MAFTNNDLIQEAYRHFNARNIDAVLALMRQDVHWPNGWEGGYVHGHEEVKNYWTRQWKELNPIVNPIAIRELPEGKIEVLVHQLVKDNGGTLLFDGNVKHIYTIVDGLIEGMEIQQTIS